MEEIKPKDINIKEMTDKTILKPLITFPYPHLPRTRKGYHYDNYTPSEFSFYHQKIREHELSLKAHSHPIDQLCISPDGDMVVSKTAENINPCLWKIKTGNLYKVLTTPFKKRLSISCMNISKDGNFIFIGLNNYNKNDPFLRIFDMKSGDLISERSGLDISIKFLDFSSDNKTLIALANDRLKKKTYIIISDRKLYKKQRIININNIKYENGLLSPDNKTLICWGPKGVLILDLPSCRYRKFSNLHHINLIHLIMTPDGNLILSAAENYSHIQLWNIKKGNIVKTLPIIFNNGGCFKITPDGSFLIYMVENTIKILELVNDKIIVKIKIDQNNMFKDFQITPDSTKIITLNNNFLSVYDIKTGLVLYKLNIASIGICNISKVTAKGEFACGLVDGSVKGYILRGGESIPPLTMIKRPWLFKGHPALPYLRKWGRWGENLIYNCFFCGNSFEIEEKTIKNISRIKMEFGLNKSKPYYFNFPKKVFNDPGLLSSCPKCKNSLRFNPFFIDNSNLDLFKKKKNIRFKNDKTDLLCENCGGKGQTRNKIIKTIFIFVFFLCLSIYLPFLSLWWLIIAIPLGVISIDSVFYNIKRIFKQSLICNDCEKKFIRD